MTKTLSQDENGDLFLDERGNLAVATEGEGVRQQVTSAVRLWQGEWFLDETQGVPYLQELLKKGTGEGRAAAILNTEILNQPFVTRLSAVSTSYDPVNRRFSYSANVDTEYGSVPVGFEAENL